MFEDYLPKRKIGTLCPLAVIDNHAYEFYQLVPSGVMLVMVQLAASGPDAVPKHDDIRAQPGI